MQLAFLRQFNRAVSMPPGMAAPDSWFCTAVDHEASAACVLAPPGPSRATQPTYVGAYAPYAYLVPGEATHLGDNPVSALTWARLADMLFALALIASGCGLLWEAGAPTSMLGAALALSPMVIFTSAVLTSSTAELAAAFCALGAVIRLWRTPASAPAAYGLGISGAVLVLARPFGPLWGVAVLALMVALLRADGLREFYRGSPRRVHATAALVFCAAALNIGWQLAVTPPARPMGQLVGFIPAAVASLPETFGEAIGVFGWDDTLMPRPAYGAFGLALVALLAAALLVGRRREVRVLELCLVVVTGGIVALTAVAVLPTGFTAQGRYMLPALMALPLLAGEIVNNNRQRLGRRSGASVVATLVAVAAVVQIVAWHATARRFAVGAGGPWLFFTSAQWQPPLGWGLWTMLAALGTLALVGSGLLGLRSGRPAG